MYNKVNTDMNFVEREKEVEKFWKENDTFRKSMERRKDGPTYTFYDGPPTANGKPHIGHVLTRVIKDMIPRYRTMKGCMVPRKAGWDTHGRLSPNVRRASGNTRACGRISPAPSASGQIWTTLMSLITTTLSSPNGGH